MQHLYLQVYKAYSIYVLHVSQRRNSYDLELLAERPGRSELVIV